MDKGAVCSTLAQIGVHVLDLFREAEDGSEDKKTYTQWLDALADAHLIVRQAQKREASQREAMP